MSGPRAAKREAKGPEGEWTTDYLARQSRNQIGNEFYRRPQSREQRNLIFPRITRIGSPDKPPQRILQEATEATEEMTSDTNRCSDSEI